MSALDTLKNILGEPNGELHKPDTTNPQLDNLFKYVSSSHCKMQLLELIRIDSISNMKSEDDIEIHDLFKLSAKFQRYQEHISQHKKNLVPVETILNSFNQELNQLSTTLISLQQQSTQLSADSNLQQAITENLNPIILDLMIPPEVVRSIIHDKIDLKWVDNIKFINEKLNLIEAIKGCHSETNGHNSTISDEKKTQISPQFTTPTFKEPFTSPLAKYKDSHAFQQLQSGIELLVLKAVERIRDFIISQIKTLRSSTKTSSQTIQQNLLQVKEIYIFLQVHHPALSKQLKLAYIYTMRWYYQTRFAKYNYALEDLNIRHIDLNHVLGGTTDEKGLFGLKSWLSPGSSLHPPTNPPNQVSLTEYLTSIDKRLEVLDSKDHKSAILSQIAETTPFAYWLEFIYNQWNLALVDNVVVEYLFMVDFFYQGSERFEDIREMKKDIEREDERTKRAEQGANGQNTRNATPQKSTETSREQNSKQTPSSSRSFDWSHLMFNDIYKIGNEFVSWLVTHNPTTYSRGNNSANVARNMTASVNHGSCDAYGILLMIRLTQQSQSLLHNEFHIPILDDHLNSILLLLWPQFTKIIDLNCESLRKSIIRGGKDSHLAPLSVTQQFAQFLLGLLKLATNQDKSDYKGEPLYNSVNRLRNDFESLLTKLSNSFFGGRGKATEKEIFLYNNYFLVVNILKNENGDELGNMLIGEQIKHFETLCGAYQQLAR
jgi:hypothetical protein